MCNLHTQIWSQEQKCKSKNADFYKFLDIYLVYLGNKDMYSIFKGMLYNLCFISHKLPLNSEIYHTSFKRYNIFHEVCTRS